MKIRTYWYWPDCWIGFFWDRKKRILYVCPVPCFVIEINMEKEDAQ